MSRRRIYQMIAAACFLILGAGPMILDLGMMIAEGSNIRSSIDIESALSWIMFILIAVVLFANLKPFFLLTLFGIKVFQELYVTIWVVGRGDLILTLWNGGYLVAFGLLLIVLFRRSKDRPYGRVDRVLSILSVAAFIAGHLIGVGIWGGYSAMSILLWVVECVALAFTGLWIREWGLHGSGGETVG